jgi:type IV pilus assembly protein PilA
MNRIRKSDRLRCRKRGFSVIELLVVLGVILIIAALAIPRLLRARMSMNEASAVQSLRSISSAEVIYSVIYGIGFSDSLAKLSGNGVVINPNNAGLIDQVLASGIKSGYVFTFTVLSTDSSGRVITYSVTADPIAPGSSGRRYFYEDQTSVIRVNNSVPAGPSDNPID